MAALYEKQDRAVDVLADGTDYPTGFYPEQSPVHLRYLAALQGHAGPEIDAPFDYCELGCGPGETVTMLAAAHPRSRFVGIDLNPAFIDYAGEVASAAGVENLRLIAADVGTYDLGDLPDFDFITLHGLYSWVPANVQSAIRAFIASKLKRGGLAYVSYNAMPGWAAAEPVRHFFIEAAKRLEGDSLEIVARILEILAGLADRDAPFFKENPMARELVEKLRKADPRYVAHEFLGPNWEPLYAEQVHSAMQHSGLEFVGDADIDWGALDPGKFAQVDTLLPGSTDRRTTEWLTDFTLNRYFRRDIFAWPCGGRPARDPLDGILLGTVGLPIQAPERVNLPDGSSIDLGDPWHVRVRELLAYRVLSVAELAADPALAEAGPEEVAHRLRRLTVGGYFTSCATREVRLPRKAFDSVRATPRLNALRLERHDWNEPYLVLMSPVTGSAVSMSTLEVALLSALEHEDPAAHAHAELKSRGIDIRPTGDGEDARAIEDEAEAVKAIGHALAQFTSAKLPKLACLGVIEGV